MEAESAAKPTVGVDDPVSLWAALMADVGHHNAAAWLDHFELRRIDANKQPAQATLSPKPAAGHAIRFATPPRLERLGQHLTRLSGVAVRVQLAEMPTAQQQHDRRIAEAETDSGSGANAAEMPSAPSGGIDRRDALGLPIVRDAFEVFPDAIMIDARREMPAKTEPAADPTQTSEPEETPDAEPASDA